MAKSPVVVYTRTACVQCIYTKQLLDKEGIPYSEMDISQAPEVEATAKAAGATTLPVVTAGDLIWYGFSPDKIKALKTA